jgi:CBS domain containing-hemolysin-like protein
LATLLAQRLWGAGAVALTTVVTTVVVFFVSEMLPKTLAGTHCDTLALALAPSLRFLMRLLYPVSIVFTKVSNAISRLFGSKPTPTVTEEELVDLIDNMESADPEAEAQNQLLQSAMAFDRKTAQQVMTPYDQAEVLDEGLSPRDILQFCKDSRHSRVPVIRKGSTNVIGVLFLRDYIKVWTANREETRLRPLLRAPMLVPPDVPIDELLRYNHLHHYLAEYHAFHAIIR